MRLWHKYLISYLPKAQLLGQWRECVCIAKNIAEKDTPDHILVNPIMYYPIDHFYAYCRLVYNEMINRGYKADWNKLDKWTSKISWLYIKIDTIEMFNEWHNRRYLRQCLYNLEEKFMRGAIPPQEWLLVSVEFGKQFDLIDSLYTEKHEGVVQ